jgi:hypothetical protein
VKQIELLEDILFSTPVPRKSQYCGHYDDALMVPDGTLWSKLDPPIYHLGIYDPNRRLQLYVLATFFSP